MGMKSLVVQDYRVELSGRPCARHSLMHPTCLTYRVLIQPVWSDCVPSFVDTNSTNAHLPDPSQYLLPNAVLQVPVSSRSESDGTTLPTIG
jgi:hypothetical protein